MAQIVLKDGRTLTGNDTIRIPGVRVSRYQSVEVIGQRLDDFEADWQEAAQEQGLDMAGITVNLTLFFDDLRRMFELPEKHPEQVD